MTLNSTGIKNPLISVIDSNMGNIQSYQDEKGSQTEIVLLISGIILLVIIGISIYYLKKRMVNQYKDMQQQDQNIPENSSKNDIVAQSRNSDISANQIALVLDTSSNIHNFAMRSGRSQH